MTTTTTPAATPAESRGQRQRPPADRKPGPRHGHALRVLEVAFLAVVAFVPLLAVRPGIVTSDTKTYLYLDPVRFLSQVAYMWNPTVALGTVTHEYIGYLLPMGPFFALTHVLHVPVWIAQRLWLGGILLAAGAGVLYLGRLFALRAPGRVVAALAYMVSPYFLQYAGRISVILLPWAGLPWLVALAVLALRRGGWRHAALFALVVALVSGINASSILYVGVAPIVWLVYAVVVEREASWGRAAWCAGKIALLSAAVCLWWVVGLAVEGAYGVNVLKYTETIPATSMTSSAAEVIRGLGYWYFYGSDRLGPWTNSAVLYTQQVWLLATSYAVPVVSFVSAAVVRWRYRSYFVLLVVVGMVLSVGAHPFDHPTAVGHLLRAFMTDTTAGLAMRSTDRATPLVVLGLAMLLGSGISALWRRAPWPALALGGLAGALVLANNPALFNGDTVANGFTQPASLPAPELQAIAHLNRTHAGLRVLAIPGDDFASYRWGDTVDPPQPALLNRPFVIHEQQVMGSLATADTLAAIDTPIQDDTENWNSLAPMARLVSAGDILVENDTEYEHYGIPQPQLLARQLHPTPPGLTDPRSFGPAEPNVSKFSTLDEQDLAAPANTPWPPALQSFTVQSPRPITRAESDTGALVVAGDASGLAALAGDGLLDTTSAIYYAGTLDEHRSQLRQLVEHGATLVVTDTNRKQAWRWDTITANTGYTENTTEHPEREDPSDSPMQLFPGTTLAARTTATDIGAVDVTASSYGNPFSYTPEDRPYSAIDGDTDTAWRTGAFIPDPAGQWWQVRFGHRVSADHITLVQPLYGNLSRWLTRVTLTFDGHHPITVALGPQSRTAAGQVVRFPMEHFETLRITIDATSDDTAAPAVAAAVGLAEVEIPAQHVTELIDMPTDLLSDTGEASQSDRLIIAMTREKQSGYPPRFDPESVISRRFVLPTARTFTLSGQASVSSLIADDAIDRLMGRPGANGSGIVAYSSGRLPGDLTAGAGATLDGNPRTVWSPGFGVSQQVDSQLHYNLPQPITFGHLDLQVVADGRHSVPTSIVVSAASGSRALRLPSIADKRTPGAVTSVPLNFTPLTGNRITITFTGVRIVRSVNYYSSAPLALPLGIAEVGIPGLHMPPDPPDVPGNCRSDLISIDGRPISVAVVGTTATALAGGELAVVPCGPDARGITLGRGPHVVETALGHVAGWNIDQIVLDSAPGGGAAAPATFEAMRAPQPGGHPRTAVTAQSTTSQQLTVAGATSPFELVLGQSINQGWSAVATPGPAAPPGSHAVDLGRPELVDAFANGWPVTAADLQALGATGAHGDHRFTVSLVWTPQRYVWAALTISALGIVVCLLIVFVPERRRRAIARRLRRLVHRAPPRHGRARGIEPADEEHGAHLAETSAASGSVDPAGNADGAADEEPWLSAPWRSVGRRPRWWAIPVVAVVTGAVAAAVSAPLMGVVAGALTAAALAVPQVRVVVLGGALGLLAAAAASVVSSQALHPLPESSNWPTAHEGAGLLVWLAVVLLGCDAVVESARRIAARRADGARARTRPGALDPTSTLTDDAPDLGHE